MPSTWKTYNYRETFTTGLFTTSRYIDSSKCFSFYLLRKLLVVVERCPPPPPKPQPIIYERYLPPPPQRRQVVIERETCQPTACVPPPPQPTACRRVVREIVRQVPQQCAPAQPAVVCSKQNQQQVIPGQSQVVQQLVPVYSQRQVS